MTASKIIKIHVDCDIINKEIYMIVVESILKYILYQFQQVPLQIDVLEKELNKSSLKLSESSSSEPSKLVSSTLSYEKDKSECPPVSTIAPEEETTNPRTYLKQKAFQRKANNAQRICERKRGIWLEKIKKYLHNFQSTLKVLQKEINNGVVRSTVYVVGTTPFTPKFVFKIHIPSNPTSPYFQIRSSSEPNAKTKILTYLLRAFTNNADMIHFTSSQVSLTKLWTLLERENLQNDEAAKLCPENLIIRPDYTISPRTKLIEVFLREKIVLVNMELTPCVGAIHRIDNGFLRPSQRKRSKRTNSRDSYTPLSSCRNEAVEDVELGVISLEDEVSCDRNTVPATPCVQVHLNDGELDLKLFPPPVFPQTPITGHISANNKKYQTPNMIETPVVSSSETPVVSSRSLMFETPVVLSSSSTPLPVKIYENTKDISLTPNIIPDTCISKSTTWYQVDFPLCGFKDVYWSS